jgi:hypothetical protein
VRLRTRTTVFAACAVLALATFAAPLVAGAQAKWTFAIYMDSDNDLDAYAVMNIQWLMSAPTSKSVNFLVLWDSSTGPAKLLKITHDKTTELTDFALDGKEVNMGDPATLVAFVDYINAKYAAKNVMLDLWDHGDDFRGICYDYDTGTSASFDMLTHKEIGMALAGEHVNIIAGDGCGIGCIEAAYEYVTAGISADWFVANENYVPLEGFPYNVIASDLVANPVMTPEQLSQDLVVRYSELYQGGWLTELSAIKLSAIRNVVSQLWDVTSILTNDMKDYRGLVASGKAKATMGWSQYGWEGFVDFPMVFKVIHDGAPAGSDLEVQTSELLDAIHSAVPYIGMSTPGYVWDFGGMAVFFPGAEGSYVHNTFWYGSLYPTMQFAQDGWLSFLDAYFGGK